MNPKRVSLIFSGRLDLVRFLETAQKVGLYALVRPGPHLRRVGLRRTAGLVIAGERPAAAVQRSPLFGPRSRLFPGAAAKAPAFAMQPGGNLLALQVENEYGSYGNDKTYLRFLGI